MPQTKVKSIGSVTIKSPNVYELVMTTFDRIESEYVLNELVRNKANAKKAYKELVKTSEYFN